MRWHTRTYTNGMVYQSIDGEYWFRVWTKTQLEEEIKDHSLNKEYVVGDKPRAATPSPYTPKKITRNGMIK